MPYPGWVQSSQIAPSLREYVVKIKQSFKYNTKQREQRPNQYNMIVQANWVPVYKRSCDLVGCVSEDQIVTVILLIPLTNLIFYQYFNESL